MRWVLRMNREANAAKIDAVLAAAGDRPIVEVSIRQYPRGLSVGAMTARMLSWIKALKKASLSYPISAIRWAGRSSVRILNVVRRGVVCLPAYEVEGERDAVDIIWRFPQMPGNKLRTTLFTLERAYTSGRGRASVDRTCPRLAPIQPELLRASLPLTGTSHS